MFYIKLQELCNNKKITITNLALELGISRSNVTNWKNGSIPKSDKIQKIAEYFNVSTDYLLTGKEASADDLKAADPLREELLNIAKGLSEENQKALLAMAKSLKESSQQKK